MTERDAKQVAAILAEADGQCVYCAGRLATSAQREFPEFDWFVLVAAADGHWTPEGLRNPS